MTRADIRYNAAHSGAAPAGSLDAGEPISGLYRFKLRSDGHPVAVRLWNGPPNDPETGEVLDRSWRWQASVNGEPVDFDRVWPACGANAISEDEYEHLIALHFWGKENAPDGPQAKPWKSIDPLSCPPPF